LGDSSAQFSRLPQPRWPRLLLEPQGSVVLLGGGDGKVDQHHHVLRQEEKLLQVSRVARWQNTINFLFFAFGQSCDTASKYGWLIRRKRFSPKRLRRRLTLLSGNPG
jgi:hypothetical protein